MSVNANLKGGFSKEYLEEGIARMKEENKEISTPETEAAIKLAEQALEELEK